MTTSRELNNRMDRAREALADLIDGVRTQANIQEDMDMRTKILMHKIERFLEPVPGMPWDDPSPFAGAQAELLEEVRQWLYS